MDPGNEYTGDLGTQRFIWRIWNQVGCNDGETGEFTIWIDGNYITTYVFSCHDEVWGPAYGFQGRVGRYITTRMISGGGDDNHISYTCCNIGLGADWR